MLAAAIVICALCVPGAVLIWRLGGLWMQAEFLAYKQSKYREAMEDTSKQAHEMQLALAARIGTLEASLGASVDGLATRIVRLENGRVLQERRSA
jgi:putative Mn2+ efflux pump MntP